MVSDHPASDLADATGGFPKTAVCTSQWMHGNCITFRIKARCAEASAERPVVFSGTITAPRGSDAERELEEFDRYGRTPTVPLTVRDFLVDVPGGLGGEFASGVVRIGRPESDERFERRLSVLTPYGRPLAEVDLTINSAQQNHDGTGISNRGSDPADFLTVEFLTSVRDGGHMMIRFHRGDPTGHFPDKIEPSLALLEHCAAPNRLRIAPVRGTRSHIQDLPSVERDQTALAANRMVLEYVRALSTIQPHVEPELTVPDLEAEPTEDITEVVRAARLIRGEVLDGTWDKAQFTLSPGAPLKESDELIRVMVCTTMQVTIGGVTHEVGTVQCIMDAAQVTNLRVVEDGETTADLVPANDQDGAQWRWLGGSAPTPAA